MSHRGSLVLARPAPFDRFAVEMWPERMVLGVISRLLPYPYNKPLFTMSTQGFIEN